MDVGDDGARYYSATDLLTWHACAHASRLDALALADQELRDWLAVREVARRKALDDGIEWPEPANVRGDQHERAMLQRLLDEGLKVVEIPRPRAGHAGLLDAVRATTEALEGGADVVYQAALLDGAWFGYADFLVRVDGHGSRFGDYAYEVRDTKLARSPSAGALIQMAHYGAILSRLQDADPPSLVVWLGTGEEFRWAYRDAVPYLDEMRSRFLAFSAEPGPTEPTPVDLCPRCRWYERCDEEWGPADLRHVHRLTRRQRSALIEHGVTTVAQLAVADQRPEEIGDGAFRRLRAQAAAQVGEEPFAIIRPQRRHAGAAGTPEPHPLDLYFDLEGDPYAAMPSLDYLWAWYDADGYSHRWAHDAEAERAAFTWFLDELHRREALGGDWHVYHYNSYEVTALERIAENWPDPVESARLVLEVQRLVGERFDDLYRRVEAGVRTRDGSTSLKVVEQLAGYDRGADAAAVARADDSIKAYEAYLSSIDSDERDRLLEGIRAYNEHDVRATHAIHLWLRGLATELSGDDLENEPVDDYEPSPDVRDRIVRTAERQRELYAAIEAGALPSGLSVESARMLAEMLEWHRREFVVAYQDFLRLKDWAAEREIAPDDEQPDLGPDWLEVNAEAAPTRLRRGMEHESCLLDIQLVRVHPPEPGKTARLREYRAHAGAWKIKAGTGLEEVVLPGQDRKALTVRIEEHDPDTGSFSFRCKDSTLPAGDLGPLVISPFLGPKSDWESLMGLAEAALTDSPAEEFRSGLRLLERQPPLPASAMAPRAGEEACDRARRLLPAMSAGLLPVQGPPGTGKTWLGAQLVLDEITRGNARIGVVANSHRVIDNLLGEVVKLAAERGVDIAVGHVASAAGDVTADGVARMPGGARLVPWLDAQQAAGRPAVVGATKFGWSRADAASSVGLLVVDEAGQVALADALAVAQASARVVALGDPQQLASPIQASHDASVRVSLLEHLAQGRAVLPAEVGVFLDISHRMHPALCEVVGELAYDGALNSSPAAAARGLSGPDVVVDGFRIPLRPGVLWVPCEAKDEEQAAFVAALVKAVVAHGVVTDGGAPGPLQLEDVLVVSPHNAHVNRIAAALEEGDRVGTVDRFQGQQGHVVVYAMSRPAEEAGDVPFLYEINRVNVALSRARLMAIVVAHPDATFPPVRTPEHLLLASRFARVVEGRKAGR